MSTWKNHANTTLNEQQAEKSTLVLYTCQASLVAQMVKRLPTKRETQVRSLGWEDPLEKEMATHSNSLAWKISMHRGAW